METPNTPAPQPSPNGAVKTEAPVTSSGWLVRHGSTVLFTVIAIGVLVTWLSRAEDPLLVIKNLSKVVVGLGLVIFIHELGHFVAAKWCDVHVETFSIGFGPPLFGICQFKWGETTYKLAWIPLGGYVKMLGENPEDENADLNPRSYKNKSVGARMLIISAGVIMNIALAVALFLVVYLTHGVRQNPGIVGQPNPGGAAWQKGLRRGDHIRLIGSRSEPYYEDIQRTVVGSKRNQPLSLVYDTYSNGTANRVTTEIVPLRDDDDIPIPMIGVQSAQTATLINEFRHHSRPCQLGSVADRVEPGFAFGDRVVATTNPDQPDAVTPLPSDPRQNDPNRPDYFELLRRMERLNGKPMTLRVERGSSTLDITVPPAYGVTLGLRMKMGAVAAVRQGSPAAKAGIKPQHGNEKGDVITAVEFIGADGKRRRLSSVPAAGEEPLDPVRLPTQLALWAESGPPNYEILVTVLRSEGHEGSKPVPLKMVWQKDWDLYDNEPFKPDAPMGIAPLGIAYRVQNVIEEVEPGSPAAGTALKPNSAVTKLEFSVTLPKRDYAAWWPWKLKDKKSISVPVKDNEWAYYWSFLQGVPELQQVTLFVGEEKVTLVPNKDASLPLVDRGLIFASDVHIQKANNIGDAFVMSGTRLVDKMSMIYENLIGMVVGRLSLKAISGPISIAEASYDFAGRDTFEFLLFLALININLAVVNFLPIPVLDGGHMVFLIYEWLRGKPPSDRIRYIATFLGLAFILCLMAWGIYLDVSRRI